MKNQKEYTDISKDILSPKDTWTIASNLNAVERERERQNNPGRFEYFLWLVVEMGALPLIVVAAFDLFGNASSALGFIAIFIGMVLALMLDWLLIRATWQLFRM